MSFRRFLHKSALVIVSLVAAVGISEAAMTFSTGTGFLPGPRLIDGSDLNVMVAAVNTLVSQMAGALPITGGVCTATAASNAGTCTGSRGLYTTASLSTAHSAAATAQVITDTAVTANSVVQCTVDGYSGTFGTNGNPTVACVPTANTITATIVNAADTNALSGTVTVGFLVFN